MSKNASMHISGLRVQNFKRFTDLTIEGIKPDCKLVVLIGANGSGKSSIFDAFEFLSRNAKRGHYRPGSDYERKDPARDASVEVQIHGEKALVRVGDLQSQNARAQQFFGRSSNRVVPQAKPVSDAENVLLRDSDGPELFILPDERFNTDLELYVARIEKALREAFIAEKRDEAPEIRKELIEPLNDALLRVFGDRENLAPQLVNWEAARIGSGAQLIFLKGSSRITYDLLSHGEKQVLILLLDFLVRRELLTGLRKAAFL